MMDVLFKKVEDPSMTEDVCIKTDIFITIIDMEFSGPLKLIKF